MLCIKWIGSTVNHLKIKLRFAIAEMPIIPTFLVKKAEL